MSVFTNPASASIEQARSYTAAVVGLVGDDDPVTILRATPDRIARTIEGVGIDRLSAPEGPGKWSVRQVIRHLADSEVVWAWRLRLTLAHDRPPLTGYDQDLWADRLGYQEADPFASLEELRVLRQGTLRLLERCTPEDLDRVAIHSERGEESVAHMMRMYAGHDRLHLRQIDRILAAVS